eukprot:scaffold387_cov136-Skeletonema_menzelii.AAC.4
MHIYDATWVNKQHNPGAAGREKLIQTQLNSARRAELAEIQGVNHSLYSEIDPLHLPEVLALVGHRHGQRDLYVALKSSIAGVISTVNRKQCLKQQKAHHEAVIAEHKANLEALIAEHETKVEAIEAEIAAIEASDDSVGGKSRTSKKRRAC